MSYGLIALGEGRRLLARSRIAASVPQPGCSFAQKRGPKSPMMPLSLFRNPSFSGANALTLLLYAALGGGLFLLPYLLIDVHGYSATAAGAAFLPFSAIMGLGSRGRAGWWNGSARGRP